MNVLFEYDTPINHIYWLNYSPSVYFCVMVPGNVVVTDDNSNTGYYPYTNDAHYKFSSAKVDSYDYAPMATLLECLATDASFFYDSATTRFYIHILDEEALLSKSVVLGRAIGFSFNDVYYFNNFYYEPRLSSIPTMKWSIDPLFYGLHKYQPVNIGLINNDGKLDDWESRNLYGQAARIYVDEVLKYSGFIEDYNLSWSDLSVKLQDLRKSLSQPVATRTLKEADYPYLSEGYIDKIVPVAYGPCDGRKALLLTGDYVGTYHTFLICDTSYNAVESLDAVYIDGVAATPVNVDLALGTFQLTQAATSGNTDAVTCDFTIAIDDSVAIIKDLMWRYDGKPFIASFWDTVEVNAAAVNSQKDYLYIDDDSALSKAIETMCIDSSLRMFTHDDGLYTIRAYDANRTPIKTIPKADFKNDYSATNNSSEYLTSCIIKYGYNADKDTWLTYEEKSYENAAYYKYKKLKSKTFETNLTDLAGATDKAQTIMDFSSNVQNIISRKLDWIHSDIEITDFIICDPITRITTTEAPAIYEVLSVAKDPDKGEVTITMRYVKADPTINYVYSGLSYDGSDYITDENDNVIQLIEVPV